MTIDSSTLKVAIAGAGLMGHWHAKTAKRLDANIVAVLDQDLSRANKLASAFDSVAGAFTDLDALLQNAKPDVLHVCTPLESHYAIALQAMRQGLHVMVEKPLAMNAFETRVLLKAARDNGVNLCPVHQLGFQRGVRDASGALGSMGEVLELRFTVCSAGGQGREGDELNRIVADIIPHPLSLVQKICPGTGLDTRHWQGQHPGDGELQLMGGADTVAINISISMNARPTRCEMEVFCSGGRIFLNLFHGYAVIETGRVSRVQKLLQPFKYALKEMFMAGSNVTRRGLSGEFAYPGLNQLQALFYRSVISGGASPIAAEEILAVAEARDDIAGRFLPGCTTGS